MEFSSYLFSVSEYIGIISCSISGSIIAHKFNFDMFGVMLCGILNALGGGILRDILIGSLPPRSFYNYTFLLISVLTSLTVFFIFRIIKNRFTIKQNLLRMIFMIVDAIGLASFSMSGVQIAIGAGYSDNIFLCVFLGMTTAIGGGILRDIITAQIPIVFREQIYATASIFGSFIYCLAVTTGADTAASMFLSMLIIIAIRLLSVRYKWHLPN